MQNLIKLKLPTPRMDGKPGAHPIRKQRYYLEDDGNLTPSESAKAKKTCGKPLYVLASSREAAIQKLITWLKDDRRVIFGPPSPPVKPKPKKKPKPRTTRVEEIKEEAKTEEVVVRCSISPLVGVPKPLLSDSWKMTLEGIFLECIRTFWLISRIKTLEGITVDQEVSEKAMAHPIKNGFLVSSSIDVCLAGEGDEASGAPFTTLSYLTPDRLASIDHLLTLNKRGIRTMERFIGHFSRPTTISEAVFDSLNHRLVVSSGGHFTVEPYLRLKSVPYIS